MQHTSNLNLNKPEGTDTVNIDDLNDNADILDGKFGGSSGHKHTGSAGDGAPIPINGVESGAKTTAGGSEANRLAVTNSSGRVGDSEKVGGIEMRLTNGYLEFYDGEEWKGAGGVKSVQRGFAVISSESHTVNITINTVNTGKTTLNHLGQTGLDPQASRILSTIELIDENTIKITSSEDEGGYNRYVSWEAIEYV